MKAEIFSERVQSNCKYSSYGFACFTCLTKDHFAKDNRILRKRLFSYIFCDFCVKKENKKLHESTRDQYENGTNP